MFLNISQNSQEKTCARVSFLIKLKAEACNFVKKRLWHRYFPVHFAKFLRKPFLQNICEQKTFQQVWRNWAKNSRNLKHLKHLFQPATSWCYCYVWWMLRSCGNSQPELTRWFQMLLNSILFNRSKKNNYFVGNYFCKCRIIGNFADIPFNKKQEMKKFCLYF